MTSSTGHGSPEVGADMTSSLKQPRRAAAGQAAAIVWKRAARRASGREVRGGKERANGGADRTGTVDGPVVGIRSLRLVADPIPDQVATADDDAQTADDQNGH